MVLGIVPKAAKAQLILPNLLKTMDLTDSFAKTDYATIGGLLPPLHKVDDEQDEMRAFCKCMLAARFKFSEGLVDLIAEGLRKTPVVVEWSLEGLLDFHKISLGDIAETVLGDTAVVETESFIAHWSELKEDPVFTLMPFRTLGQPAKSMTPELKNVIDLLFVSAALKAAGKKQAITEVFEELKPTISAKHALSQQDIYYNSNSQIFMIAEAVGAFNAPRRVYDLVADATVAKHDINQQIDKDLSDRRRTVNRADIVALLNGWEKWIQAGKDLRDQPGLSSLELSCERYMVTSSVLRKLVEHKFARYDNEITRQVDSIVLDAAQTVVALHDPRSHYLRLVKDDLRFFWYHLDKHVDAAVQLQTPA